MTKTYESLSYPEITALMLALAQGQEIDMLLAKYGTEASEIDALRTVLQQANAATPAGIANAYPWCVDPAVLLHGRLPGAWRAILGSIRTQSTATTQVLDIPPVVDARGWQLRHAVALMSMLPSTVFEFRWTVEITAIQMSGLDIAEDQLEAYVADAFHVGSGRTFHVVTHADCVMDADHLQVRVSRPDLVTTPGIGEALQGLVVMATLHYRALCLRHAQRPITPGLPQPTVTIQANVPTLAPNDLSPGAATERGDVVF